METYIDEVNQKLLNELRHDFEIKILTGNYENAAVLVEGKNATLYINPETSSAAHFSHELLHIWFKKFEVFVGGHLANWVKCSDESIKRIFVDDLINHLSNCCEHLKMFPKFIALGYCEEEFVINGHMPQVNVSNIETMLECYYSNGYYSSNAIELFIAEFFSMRSDQVNFNYDKYLLILKITDDKLYSILDDFWESWSAFDYSNQGLLENNYLALCGDFEENFERWIRGKSVLY